MARFRIKNKRGRLGQHFRMMTSKYGKTVVCDFVEDTVWSVSEEGEIVFSGVYARNAREYIKDRRVRAVSGVSEHVRVDEGIKMEISINKEDVEKIEIDGTCQIVNFMKCGVTVFVYDAVEDIVKSLLGSVLKDRVVVF